MPERQAGNGGSPSWRIVATGIGSVLISGVFLVTGWLVTMLVDSQRETARQLASESDARIEADQEIRDIISMQAQTDAKLTEWIERIDERSEENRVDIKELINAENGK